MRFTESEINMATRLRSSGLTWGPEPGHYVFDVNGMIRAGSPFQAGIYLIHSANTFESMVGGQDELLENFVWLPTWENCRSWLTERGVGPDAVYKAWKVGSADGMTDRECLYKLILEVLELQAIRR